MSLKQAIIIRKDLKMGCGKAIAQGAHASLMAFIKNDKDKNEEWIREGMKKIVLKVNSLEELMDIYKKAEKKFSVSLIKDAGYTQVEPGSITAIAIGPDEEEKIDLLIKNMKLY